ncbi:MAG: zinc-binding dehydrogenase, partial [Sphingomonadaceae bacterium]
MRAAVMQGLHQPLAIETIADPSPDAGEVIVKVGRCGICGSDLHMTEDPAYGKAAGDVLGHEFAGEVVALGEGAEGLALGDLVSVIPLQSCGTCASCQAGEVAWCDQFGLQGGGYAEYAVTRPNQCIKLPTSASLADGAIIEPLAVALHGV